MAMRGRVDCVRCIRTHAPQARVIGRVDEERETKFVMGFRGEEKPRTVRVRVNRGEGGKRASLALASRPMRCHKV